MIDGLKKLEYEKATRKNATADTNKNVYTMREYFEAFGVEKFNTATFYTDEEGFLLDLLTVFRSKHYKHLRFLSSRHMHFKMKLRFITKPFSFLFSLESSNNYHLIWEILDTEEATYIWHSDKNSESLKKAFKKIEEVITEMKVGGQSEYLRRKEDLFLRIVMTILTTRKGFLNGRERWTAFCFGSLLFNPFK